MVHESIEPVRRTQSANATRQVPPPEASGSHTPQPFRAPKLMLVNGLGQVSSLPSPIVGKSSDDEDSTLSEPETPVLEDSNHHKTLSVPNIFESPVKSKPRDYSPSLSPMKPPPSPPKRSLSPTKTIIASNEGKPRPNHRRGHHHKHSLSHQIFLPPPERPPLPLPSALPTPTLTEIFTNIRSASLQFISLFASGLALVNLVQTSTGESSLLALTFLSLTHLFSSLILILSRTMNACDVWRTTTLRFPFGLQRMEFLAQFALAIFSTFNGLYILKETIEDIIISFGSGETLVEGSGSHHHHHHYVEPDPDRYKPLIRGLT